MNTKMRFLAVPTLALGALTMASAPAIAAQDSYRATLDEINGSGGSGSLALDVHGSHAAVDLRVSGLAETFMGGPYPHVQHIHSDEQAAGECPTGVADVNADGVVSTTEGAPFYGGIVTTLTTSGATGPEEGLNLALAGMGGNYQIQRDIQLNAETRAALEDGRAVVVVHGLDPATLSAEAQAAPSDLDPALPLAATSPALCGKLVAQDTADRPGRGHDHRKGHGHGKNHQHVSWYSDGGGWHQQHQGGEDHQKHGRDNQHHSHQQW